MFFLELVEGLEIAIEISTAIVPGVARVVDILVRPEVGEEDLTGVCPNVGECIQDVTEKRLSTGCRSRGHEDAREVVNGYQGRWIFATIDAPAR